MKQNDYISFLYLEYLSTPWYKTRKRKIIKDKIKTTLDHALQNTTTSG